MNEYVENTSGDGHRVAIVASRYNEFITGRLVEGALAFCREHGVAEDAISVYWCPGSLEVAPLAARVAHAGGVDAIVCVGCVIRGETDHYAYVCSESMRGVAGLATEARVAVGNAVLTVHEVGQAVARAGDGAENKGWEAAQAALVMANHFRDLG